MMSFKLAFKSMKKNMKDYVIYFLTLVLGVAIFYIFNSLDAQQAMLEMSESKRHIRFNDTNAWRSFSFCIICIRIFNCICK